MPGSELREIPRPAFRWDELSWSEVTERPTPTNAGTVQRAGQPGPGLTIEDLRRSIDILREQVQENPTPAPTSAFPIQGPGQPVLDSDYLEMLIDREHRLNERERALNRREHHMAALEEEYQTPTTNPVRKLVVVVEKGQVVDVYADDPNAVEVEIVNYDDIRYRPFDYRVDVLKVGVGRLTTRLHERIRHMAKEALEHARLRHGGKRSGESA